MRLPGPVIGGPSVSVVWSTPRRTLIASASGRVRTGWQSTAYACAVGHPDHQVGDAQAPDRVLLRLMEVYGTLRIAAELLLHRLRPSRDEEDEDP